MEGDLKTLNKSVETFKREDYRERPASYPPLKPRTVPMEVMCVGFPRTGTQSLQKALNTLGYKSYHFTTNVLSHHIGFWRYGFEAKINGSPVYGLKEFDALLGEHSALMDYPCILFAEELIAAYPNAKVILNTRPEKEWFESFEKTIWSFWKIESPNGLPPPEHASLKDVYMHAWFESDFPRTGLNVYRNHNAKIRELCRNKGDEGFLEFNIGDGWDPLCRFLNKEPPSEPFPNRDFYWLFRQNQVDENTPTSLDKRGLTLAQILGEDRTGVSPWEVGGEKTSS